LLSQKKHIRNKDNIKPEKFHGTRINKKILCIQMSINKEILKLAIPNILSNISIPLISSVDTILMGHLSVNHLGAVGIASMIFNFIYWNFGFLRMGTTGISAQAYGENNPEKIRDTLGRAVLLALGISILVLLLAYPIQKISFSGMQVLASQTEMVTEYYYIRLLAAPATLCIYVFTGWFLGMQNAWYPLYITIVVNLINILVSYYCVTFLGLEVKGVAIGTVFAQYSGLILIMFLIKYKYAFLLHGYKLKVLATWSELSKFLRINRDIFIRTVCLTIAFAYFYRSSSSQGETILAINLILLQFLNWMSYGIDGVAYASEALVGKYKGAQNWKNLKEVILKVIIWGGVFAALYSLVYWVFRIPLIRIFTNDNLLAQSAEEYVFWMAILPLFAFLSYVWDGIYIGLTASKSMRNLMLISLVIYLLSYQVFKQYFPLNHSLWIALLFFLLSRGLLQSIWYSMKGNTIQ